MKKILITIVTLIVTTFLSIYFGKNSDKAFLFFLSTLLNGLVVGSIAIFLYRVFKKTEKTFFTQFSNLFMYYVIALSLGDLFGTITVKSRIDEYKNNIVANKKKIDDSYKDLERIAQEQDKLCPKKIDNSTVINKVYYSGLDTSFSVDIKISSYSRADLVIDELKSAINKNNLLTVSTDSSLINMKLMKVKLIYTYYDKENQYLFALKY
jgi:biopolymer transport protein ExbB/TolQ